MVLSAAHVRDVCMLNKGSKQCIFLEEGDNYNSFYCKKLSNEKVHFEEDRDNTIKEFKKKGIDPYKSTVPLGDNCEGYIYLKVLEQGYDKD